MKTETNGDRIRKFRIRAGLQQKELAEIIGVKNTTVSMWESGANSPKTDMIWKLCKALKITPSMLIGFEKDGMEEYLLTSNEKELIDYYTALSDEGKIFIFNTIKGLLEYEKEVFKQEEDILIAASGGENASEEEIDEAIEIAKKLR